MANLQKAGVVVKDVGWLTVFPTGIARTHNAAVISIGVKLNVSAGEAQDLAPVFGAGVSIKAVETDLDTDIMAAPNAGALVKPVTAPVT